MDREKVRKVATSKYGHKDRKLEPEWEEISKQCACDLMKSSDCHGFPPLDLGVSAAHSLKVDSPLWNQESQLEVSEGRKYSADDLPSLEAESDVSPEQTASTTLPSDLNVRTSANRDTESVAAERNSYLKFLNTPEHIAATWRPKDEFVLPPGSSISAATPLLLDSKKTLSCKATAITKAIIKDFCQWSQNLGGVEKSDMTEDVLQQLFQIGFDAPATRALCVGFKELPVIAESAAQACHLPE
ncbi:hypothetical protein Cfor_05188, partial [Coptotermes formosanus]